MKLKMTAKGTEVEAISVDFLPRKEDFNEYQLVDGRVIKIKLVVTRVLRLEGVRNEDGTQAYLVQSRTVIAPVEET